MTPCWLKPASVEIDTPSTNLSIATKAHSSVRRIALPVRSKKLHTFDPTYRFFSWIYRIAVNQSLNLVGRRRDQAAFDDNAPAAEPNPSEVFESTETRGHLKRALLELEPHHRTVIVLKHLEGFTYREIGELLEIPEKTVKSRLFTARQRLRVILTERGFAP